MNKDRIEGNWKQLKGKIKQKWGELTDDEIDQAEGNTQILSGKLQERYGMTRDEADRQIDDLVRHDERREPRV
ncbi:MAG: CsbD family protein [Gammaproteobacteria bacterium]|nr:CsbD family protein [Gammaproteobacteria bacterium]